MKFSDDKLTVGTLMHGVSVSLGQASFFLFIALVFSLLTAGASGAQVADTKHNLGLYSPGSVKSADTTQICVFCHTPHNSSPLAALWNRIDSGATYTVYGTGTMVSNLGQPTGSSRLMP